MKLKRSNSSIILLLSGFLLLLPAFNSKATHLVGGNLSYENLGDTDGDGDINYKITFRTYIDCNSQFFPGGFPEPTLDVGIYEGPANPSNTIPRVQTVTMPLVDSSKISPDMPNNCTVASGPCLFKAFYEATVDLPVTFEGYHLFYDRCCRNGNIVNLANPGDEGMVFNAYIGPTLVDNSSPTFSDLPTPFICVNDTTSILNTATDPDGDLLVFSFVDPYQGFGNSTTPAPPLPNNLSFPIPTVTWAGGYNMNIPFSSAGHAYINGSTGLTEYMATATGRYVVAIEVKEYRNGSLIGVTRRDLQLVVINCPPNNSPNLSPTGGGSQTNHTIPEGDSLCFDINFNDPDGDSTELQATGPIFDSTQVNPPATIDSFVVDDNTISSEFCWNTDCGQARPLPYQFTVSVQDNGCPPKTTNVVYQITVEPPAAPDGIIGPDEVCAGDSAVLYHTDTLVNGDFNWSVNGGTIASGGNNDSVYVNWGNSPGAYDISVSNTNVHGCTSSSESKTVNIIGLPFSEAGVDTSLCQGDSLQLGGNPTGPAGSSYSWNPGGSLDNDTLENPIATPITSTDYVVTVTNSSNCSNTDTASVIVGSVTMDAGNDTSACSGDSVQFNATGGVNYNWSPASGLSDTTIADPKASADSSMFYFLEITDTAGCTGTDSLHLAVDTLPAADAGPDTAICDNEQVVIGGSPTGPAGSSFSWSPSWNLNNDTIANPTASPTSDTSYIVTVMDTNQCTGQDTIDIMVNPSPTTDAGPDKTICFGDTTQLNGSGGGSYSWSPSTSLSASNTEDPFAFPSSTTDYQLIVTAPNTCSDTDSVMVNVNPLPPADAGNDTAFCVGDSVQLNASGGSAYDWTPGSGLSDSTIADPWASPSNTTGYLVTVTDSNGCIARDSLVVTVNPLPTPDAGGDTAICMEDSIQLNATGGNTYSWNPATGLSNSSIADPMASPTDTTEYFVTVTDFNGCSAIDSVDIIVNSLPPADAGSDVQFCAGDSVQLNASGGSVYDWTPGNGLSDSTITTPWAFPNDTTEYLVMVTDSNSCTAKDSVLVEVNTLPPADAGPDLWLCPGDSVQVTASGGSSYSWTPSTGLNNNTISDPMAGPADTTQYIVTVTDSNGCEKEDTVRIFVNDEVPTDPGQDTTICLGDSAQLGGNPTAPTGTNFIWWPSASLDDPNIANPKASPGSTTTYYVQASNDTCTNLDSVTVFIDSLPPVNAGNDIQICIGDSTQLNASGGNDYSWTPADSLSDTLIADPWAYPVDTTQYFVTVTDANGCFATDSLRVIVPPLPPANAGNDVQICTGDSTQLNASGGSAYDWNPGSGLSDTTIANPWAGPNDTTDYFVTVTDSNGCVATDSLTVTINPLPPANAGNDTQICIGDSTQLNASGGSSYDWSPSTGLSDTTISNPWAGPTDTTAYNVFVTDSNGCSAFDTVVVTVNPTPPADAGSDRQVCIGDSTQLTATGGSGYSWTPSTGLNDTTIADPWATPSDTTQYFVTVIDTNTCSGQDSVKVIVNPPPPADAGPDQQICLNDTIQLNGSGGSSYSWSPNLAISNINSAAPQVYPPTRTTYALTVTDSNGCQDSDSTTVRVFRVQAGPDTNICDNETAMLYVEGTDTLSQASWSPSTGLDDASSFTPTASPDSTTTYQVIAISDEGCRDTSEANFSTSPAPSANINVEEEPVCNGVRVTATDFSVEGSKADWTFEDGTSLNGEVIEHVVEYDGTYTVQLRSTSEDRCSDTLNHTATTSPMDEYLNPFIPNVFTPNGDGKNDLFRVKIDGDWSGCMQLNIYNRWGQLMYSADRPSWDGRNSAGEMATEGSYFYTLIVNDKKYQGNITLLE